MTELLDHYCQNFEPCLFSPIADYLWMYRIATMQSFAKPHGAVSLRVDSFAKLRTSSSLRSG
jgi:hypothetical protein